MRRHLVAGLVVATISLSAPAIPAQAGGFSFTLSPRGESADAIRTGLTLYGIARDLQNRAKTKQRGSRNSAAVSQSGQGNYGFVYQRGKKNTGTITQNGNYNTHGLFQFGRRNSGHVVQNGDGNVGITVQGNW